MQRLGHVAETRITRSEQDVVVGGCQGSGDSRVGDDSSVSTRNWSPSLQHGMEMLTPSPVSMITAEQSLVQEGNSQSSSSYTSTWETPTPVQFTRLQVRLQEEESPF